MLRILFISLFFLLLSACSDSTWNAPYSSEESGQNILFSAFSSPPKHLDPVVSYNSNEWQFLSQVVEPPLQYHYFKKPYALDPLTLQALPQVTYLDAQDQPTTQDKAVYSRYHFQLKKGIRYQPHPCFVKNHEGSLVYANLTEQNVAKITRPGDFSQQATRELTAQDYLLAFKRMADSTAHSPILGTMANYIVGLKAYSEALKKVDDKLAWMRQHEIAGVQAQSDTQWTIKIKGVYPQFVYWLTMNFFAPVPWEALAFYDQAVLKQKNLSFDTYPVGTGAYFLAENNPNKIIVLKKNPYFHFETFPSEGLEEASPLLQDAGQALPLIDEVRFSLEKESVPLWNKFLQGYYDASGVSSDSFDQAISVGAGGNLSLTKEMRDKGIEFVNAIQPSIYYFAFNLADPIVGGYDDQARKLRQAISIAINYEEYISIFMNGRGVAAQGPIPPGLEGYIEGKEGINPYVYNWDESLKRPVRKSIEEAKRLLAEAGYPDGKLPNGQPLTLNYDTAATGPDSQSLLNWMRKQFAKLGIELVIRATDYNRFQDKVRGAKTQLFSWGWNADYPDPENFLFLLAGENASIHTQGAGVNSANYDSPQFNAWFQQIKTLENGPQRQALLQKMVALAQQDAPWAFGFYPKDLALYHAWYHNVYPNAMVNNGLKYKRLAPKVRLEKQQQWNRPLVWPLWLLGFVLLVSIYPLIRAYQGRQQAVIQTEKP